MGGGSTFKLVPREYRTRGIVVIFSSVFKALFDLVGLAVLVPVLLLILSPEGITGNKWLSEIYTRFGFTSESTFTLVVCVGVALIILVKGLVNLGIVRFQNRYLMELYRYYAREMLDSYYRRGLLFLKSKNSAKLAYEVNNVSLIYVQSVLLNIAGMLSDTLLVAFMMIGIMSYNYLAGLMVFAVFVPIMFIYIQSVRGRLINYGKMENEERRKQTRLVQEAFRGYSEIEINNAFPEMESQFDDGLGKIAWYRRTILTVQQVPEVIIETGIAIVLAALVMLHVDAVLLGVFGVAAMRMLPTTKSIVIRWISIKNSRYAEGIIEESLDLPAKDSSNNLERIPFNESIKVENLCFSFGEDNPPVIENFSVTIKKGERIGVKGVSGGGKTTLFNLLLGLYPPTTGRIVIDDKPLDTASRRKWQNIVGYVPQDVFIMDSSIAENIALGNTIDRDRVKAVLDAARLGDFLAELPDGIDTQIGEGGSRLSGGQKQRIGIARALYKNAEVLFFDEATSALDSNTEREINDAIRELSQDHSEITILIIAHRETSLAFCDKIIEMG